MRKIYMFLFGALLLMSCSDNNDNAPDPVESITVKVNGVTRTFIEQGRGITLQADGTYKLDLQMMTNDAQTGNNFEYLSLVMRYKKKGNNTIEEFYFFANPNGMDTNLVGTNFQNKVSVNNRKQFTATFSGTMQNGNETVTLTDGYINFIYDDPFEAREK